MPGIVGFMGRMPAKGSKDLLNRMAQALEPGGEHKLWAYSQDNLGIARLSLGIVNPGPQPIWDEKHNVCVVFEGELYDTQIIRQKLTQRGYTFSSHDDAELILYLYLESGDLFPAQLNGNFITSIYDSRSEKIVLINDRLGLYPVYYGWADHRVLFASGVRAILADPALSKQVDRIAIAQFMTFDHILGDRTLLEGVKLLPQGSVMTISGDSFEITPYSSLRYPKTYSLVKEELYIDELNSLMKQSVQRMVQDDLPKAVLLSGGLDSRMIAALLQQVPGDWPLHTFTWGLPNCDDARFAREVAALTRAQHHFFPLKPDFLLKTAENAVRITDGMGNIVNLHALATLDEEVKFAQVIFKGFLGDAMFGFALRHQHWAEYDADTSIKAHLQVHEDQGVITFHPDEHEDVFTPLFQNQVGNAVIETYRDGMLASDSRMLADQRLYFDLTQRVPRMTLKGVEVTRSKAQVRLPFADNDLLDFALRVPPGLRQDRRLIQHAFQRAFPKMAQIPISWTGLPMQSNSRDLYMRARRLLQWHLYARGLSHHPDSQWKPYKDYHNWFRGVLRPWVEGILLSDRFFQRGYFKPDFVRSLVALHMAGKNQTVRIGAMIAIELWHRMFID